MMQQSQPATAPPSLTATECFILVSGHFYSVIASVSQRSKPLKTKRLLRQKTPRNDCKFNPKRVYFKTKHKMSVADSFALALAKEINAKVVSTDHHEFDAVEKAGALQFFWLR